MATIISPELSKRNKFYIPRHRYYELKHFSLQYPEWKKELMDLKYITGSSLIKTKGQVEFKDPTGDMADRIDRILRNIELIDACCIAADPAISNYILEAVAFNRPWNYIHSILMCPCGKNKFYEGYRRYFWFLDKYRDV